MNTFIIKCGLVMGFAVLALAFSPVGAAQDRAAVSPAMPAQPAAPVAPSTALHALQNEWAIIQYTLPEPEREARFAALADKARALTTAQQGRADTHLWEGIVLSSWGNAKGGLGALGIVKQARAQLEAAIAIDPRGCDGAAQMRLALLYARVPGWPIGFGDSKQAETLFKQALAIDPDGIDVNYFYADFLVQANRRTEARALLERASKAPKRPDQAIADVARRKEIEALMRQL